MADLSTFKSFDSKKALKSDVIPKGEYLIQVPHLKEMYGKNNDSTRLFGVAKIIGPASAGKIVGRTIQLSFTMEHPNEMATKIGHRQLAQMLKAVGKPDCKNTDEIAGARVIAIVDVRPASDDGKYEEQNQVNGFRPDPSAPKTAPTPAPNIEGAGSASTEGGNDEGLPF